MKKSFGFRVTVSFGTLLVSPWTMRGQPEYVPEYFFLDLDRYLRASKWKVNTAIQRLEATLKWRREFGLYDKLNADLVEPEVRCLTFHSKLPYTYPPYPRPSLAKKFCLGMTSSESLRST